MLKDNAKELQNIFRCMNQYESDVSKAHCIIENVIRGLPEQEQEDENSMYYKLAEAMKILENI